jgi:AmmeMemoRadiSam system protein A
MTANIAFWQTKNDLKLIAQSKGRTECKAVNDEYPPDERQLLLEISRQALVAASTEAPRPLLDIAALPPRLQEPRACFITLTMNGELRGCTGTLGARRSLAEEVAYSTVQTALFDPRFSPVTVDEVDVIRIEISVLTPSQPLFYDSPDDLLRRLRPYVDGVTLRLGQYRSTFLPQVWEHLADPVEFLTLLSRKMGLPGDSWRKPDMEVETYQAVKIEEAEKIL